MIATLRALQSAAKNSNSPAPMTWKALSIANQNNGAPAIDQERFAAQWDAEGEDGMLHQIVDRFDNTGLVLKTANSDQLSGLGKEKESSISKIAKQVARKSF